MNRIDQAILHEVTTGERAWWWLSFIDPDKPTGEKFLGVCIVEGFGIVSAVSRAHDLKCNPGGDVAGCTIDIDNVPARYRNRLLSKRQAQRFAG